jgi:hypothetical protein
VPVGNINLWLHICPSAPFDARIQDTGITNGILRHALDVRRAWRGCTRCVTCPITLFHHCCNCIGHPLAYSCYAPPLAEMSLCAQCSGGSFCDLTYLSGAFMFTFGHRSRDDALWRLGNNNNKQWLEKEGTTGWIFVQARSSRGVEEVRFAQSPDLPFTLAARSLTRRARAAEPLTRQTQPLLRAEETMRRIVADVRRWRWL